MNTLDRQIGLEYIEIGPDRVAAHLSVESHVAGTARTLPRGVVDFAVESVTSRGARAWLTAENLRVVSVACTISHFQPVESGDLHLLATPLYRDAARQLWALEAHDDRQGLVARAQCEYLHVGEPPAG